MFSLFGEHLPPQILISSKRTLQLHDRFSSSVGIKKPQTTVFLWMNEVSMRVGDLNLILTSQCGN